MKRSPHMTWAPILSTNEKEGHFAQAPGARPSMGGRMRQVHVPILPVEEAFRYYCPICGIELSVSNYETPGGDYFCPYCSTDQRPSRVLSI